MDVATPYAPPLGAAKPGNLYADLQTRTLWLGVDTAVDDAGAVLISDIVAMQTEIDGAVAEAKSYTDTQITTRAPLSHTHTTSQISDFNAAVTAVVAGIPGFNWVPKTIMMYSGSLADIGVGNLAGWVLCDGSNGSPDLRDRFVVGAGNKLPGTKNTITTLVTDSQGSHIHTINGTALSTAQMPYHSHGGITGYISHDHAHGVTGNTGTESHDHAHPIAEAGDWKVKGESWSLRPVGNGGQVYSGGRNQAHYHYLSFASSGVYQNHYHAVSAEGGGGAHTHTEAYAGAHAHNIASTALREATMYFALAYIMKL